MRSCGHDAGRAGFQNGKISVNDCQQGSIIESPDEIQEGISSRKITERHARALLSVEPEKQQEVYEKIVKKGMNVRQAEQLITSLKEAPQGEAGSQETCFQRLCPEY